MAKFERLSLNDAKQLLSDNQPEWTNLSWLAFWGDFWQNGALWIGPRPTTELTREHPTESLDVMSDIEQHFVSKNIIDEVESAHRDAVIGREPNFSALPAGIRERVDVEVKPAQTDESGEVVKEAITKRVDKPPTPDEERVIESGEQSALYWWDQRGMLSTLQEITDTYLVRGRVVVRMFVPPDKLKLNEQTGQFEVKAKDLPEALSYIYIDAPPLEDSHVHLDRASMEKVGIWQYTTKDELSQQDVEQAEISWVDDDGLTHIEIIDQNSNLQDEQGEDNSSRVVDVSEQDEEESVHIEMDLGGQITFYEMTTARKMEDAPDEELSLKPFISKQILQNNALVNMAMTMMGDNVVVGGFLERVVLNGQLPYEYIDDPSTPGRKKKKYIEQKSGVGVTHWITGIETINEDGKKMVATPSIEWRQPVNVKTFIETAVQAYVNILEECKQKHRLISGDANASGESRKQALADFEKSLKPTKTALDGLIRWLLQTATLMAANLTGQQKLIEQMKSLRWISDCSIDTGPRTSEEITQAISLKKERIWSRERTMIYTGVEDPDGEVAQIEEENPIDEVKLEQEKLALAFDREAHEAETEGRLTKKDKDDSGENTEGE